MAAVPIEDLPDDLRGKLVPADDLPGAENTRPAKPAEPAASKRMSLMDEPNIAKSLKVNLRDSALGAADLGVSTLASALMTPLGGVAGALEATGKGIKRGAQALGNDAPIGPAIDSAMSEGADTVRKIKGMAYQPKTQEGQRMSEGVAAPFTMAGQLAGKGLEAAGSLVGPKTAAAGQTIGENLPEAVGALYGAKILGKGWKGARALEPELSHKQESIAKAAKNGYAVNPMDSEGGAANAVVGTIANPSALNQVLAGKNADVTTRLAKKEVGLAESEHINEANLSRLAGEASKAYRAIEKAGDESGIRFTPDRELEASLMNADGVLHDLRASFPDYYKLSKLETMKDIVMNPATEPSAGTWMKFAREIRANASKQLSRTELTTDEIKGAQALKNVATSIEDFVDRKLSSIVATGETATAPALPPRVALPPPAGPARVAAPTPIAPLGTTNPATGVHAMAEAPPPPVKYGGLLSRTEGKSSLMDDYRRARTQFAKIADLREAANLQTSHVDPAVLSRLRKRGGTLTGGFADIADAHDAMPLVVHGVEGAAAQDAIRASDATLGKVSAMSHAAVELSGIPMAARHVMASKAYQKFMTERTRTSLQELKKLDPKMAAKALAAIDAASASPTSTTLPEKAMQ